MAEILTAPAIAAPADPAVRLMGGMTRAMALVGTVWTLLMALLICAEVLMRGLFNSPISGLTEFISYSVAPVMFLQLPAVALTGKLFRVELFTGRYRPNDPRHAIFGICYSLVLLAILATVGPWTFTEAAKAWSSNDYVGVPGAFELPTWPFRWTVVAGCVAMALVALTILLRDFGVLARARRLSDALDWRNAIFLLLLAAFAASLAIVPDSPVAIGTVFIGWLFVMLAMGFPIASILLGLSAVGIFMIRDNVRVTEVTMGMAMTKSIGTFEFAVVPLFVAMGLVLDRARMGEDAFQVAAFLLRRLHGGLAIATVVANAIFASVVGSSIASAAVFSRVAVPPMIANGIPLRVAVGTVAGSSVLGMLIPPSLLLIVYGLIAEQSIGQLFLAATIPGLLLAVAFAFVARLTTPKTVATVEQAAAHMSAMEIATKLGPVALLVVTILGGIYSGWFTPTEAAGVGLIVATLIAMARRTLSLRLFLQTIYEAGLISAAMLILMAAAGAYTRLLAFAQLPMHLNEMLLAADLGFYSLMAVFVLVVLAMGAVLDSVSIILIITPIILPLVGVFGADPVWFGVVLVVCVEVGLLTPPFGMSAYTVREVLSEQGVTLTDIFVGAIPFVLAMLVVIVALIAIPGIVTLLL